MKPRTLPQTGGDKGLRSGFCEGHFDRAKFGATGQILSAAPAALIVSRTAGPLSRDRLSITTSFRARSLMGMIGDLVLETSPLIGPSKPQRAMKPRGVRPLRKASFSSNHAARPSALAAAWPRSKFRRCWRRPGRGRSSVDEDKMFRAEFALAVGAVLSPIHVRSGLWQPRSQFVS